MTKRVWGVLAKGVPKLKRRAKQKPVRKVEPFIVLNLKKQKNEPIKYTTYNENGKILKLCRCEVCDVEFELTGKRKCKACIRKTASLF